ncbi:N-acetylmuramoyl-L-alanine amidase family protein [Streptomyces sp. NBC_00344]|uniref:N-acetylmuramoyl-L-alanine amidase family protein n=1 Tax=Streptomyces sp. NBC_00344 TaxID=2975720 RepID=UPI002E246DF2
MATGDPTPPLEGQDEPTAISEVNQGASTGGARRRAIRGIWLSTAALGVGATLAALVTATTGNRRVAAHHHASSATRVPPRAALDPAAFAPGACMVFAPTSGNRHRTVFLDAGHGGPDPGGQGVTTTGRRTEEKTDTLATVLDTTQLLRAEGYRVAVSRTGDSAVARLSGKDLSGKVMSPSGVHKDLVARARCANLSTASALVSVHFNLDSYASTGGALTFFDADRSFSARSRKLAGLLQHDIVAALATHGWHVSDRAATSNSTGGSTLTSKAAAYGHLVVLGPRKQGYNDHPSAMPGALVEPLFISNPAEGSIADSTTGQHTIATGIADALNEFLTKP